MTRSDIVTPKLKLVVMEADILQADAEGRDALAQALEAEIPLTWPPENWEPHVFDFLARQYTETPHIVPWNRYIVLRSATPVVIGNVNGFPKSAHEAEIGYAILSRWQGQGLATEATRALLGELFRQECLERVTAQTYPALGQCRRVLEKCGFLFDGSGDEEGTIRYRLERAIWEALSHD